MERLSPQSPYYPFVSVDPERMGGEPVFRKTRVPIKNLFDYLQQDYKLEEFLDHFEGVPREHAEAVIGLAASVVHQQLTETHVEPLTPSAPASPRP